MGHDLGSQYYIKEEKCKVGDRVVQRIIAKRIILQVDENDQLSYRRWRLQYLNDGIYFDKETPP